MLNFPNTNAIRLKKKGGAATNDGVNYENYMFLLVLLNLLENVRVEKFYIAQNVENVGAFDDLVFLVNYKPVGEDNLLTKLFLVQLKHTDRRVALASLTTSTGTGNFSLVKYYKCFKSVMNKIGKFNDIVLNECRIEDMTFVIYTNAECPVGEDNFQKDSFCREILESRGNASTVFMFNSSSRFEKFYEELKKNSNPIVNEEDGQKFLQQLVIFSNQSNSIDLKKNLVSRLEKYFIKEDMPVEDMFQRATNFVVNNNSEWLSRHCGVLYNITFNFQGIPVEMNRFHKNTEFSRKITVKYICDEQQRSTCIGKIINKEKEYYVERKVQIYRCYDEVLPNIENERFVLLCSGPGMGKSWYLTHQAYSVKSLDKEKYVIRENLLDYCSYLNSLNITTQNKQLAENFLTELAGVQPNTVDYDIFQLCLQDNDKMVIFLDGLDEISPDYFDKVCIIIQTIRAELPVKLWVSTRPILKNRMEKYFGLTFWELERFSEDDAKLFLKKYCGLEDYDLGETEKKLCEIPLFCRMFGDVIKSGDTNLPNTITNKVDLYDRFVEVMYLRYYKEKEKGDVDIPTARNRMQNRKQKIMKYHERAAVLSFFEKTKLAELKWNIEKKSESFLSNLSLGFENIGLIYNIDAKGIPIFIHRSVAEYFCGRWLANDVERYTKLKTEQYYLPLEINYFMSSKLDNLHPLFSLVLNIKEKNEIENSLKDYINEFNVLDSLGRNVLYYADISNNTNAARYIMFNGFHLTPDIINLDRRLRICNIIYNNLLLRWLAFVLMKYPHHGPLLGLMVFTSEFEDDIPYFLKWYCWNSPLHMAILDQNKRDIANLAADNVNCKNDLGLLPLHLAVWMEDESTVQLLVREKSSYNRRNILYVYPHQVLPNYSSKTEILTLLKQYYKDFMEEDVLRADIKAENYKLQNLPLHDAVQKDEFENYYNLFSNSTELIWRHDRFLDSNGRSALHVIAANSAVKHINAQLLHVHKLNKYTKDNKGYYPHHYSEDLSKQLKLMEYGFRYILTLLPPKDNIYHGTPIQRVPFAENIFWVGIKI